MKKLVISLVLGASLAIVPSAFALKAMTADSMKDTTGQAGVSIAADDITIYKSAGTTSYVDTDENAMINIEATESMTTIRAILDNSTRGGFLQNNYAAVLTSYTMNNFKVDAAGAVVESAAAGDLLIKPLTIDVSASLELLSNGKSYNYTGAMGSTAVNIVGVTIGLPTVEICKPSETKIYTASTDAGTSNNDGFEYITVRKTNSVTAILGGTIEIAPH